MKRLRSGIEFLADDHGVAMVEFTIVFPLLLTVMMGVIQFGWILNNKNALTNATAAGARQLSISRGDANAYTDTVNAVQTGAATMLSPSSVKITVSINGVACSTDAACSAALDKALALPATVSTTYPCFDLAAIALLPPIACTLQSTLTMSVQ